MRAWTGFVAGMLAMLCAAPAIAVTATPLMWTVHGPRGNAYLLGSIHVLPKGVDWQTGPIREAMAKADTFVFEVPMDRDTRARAAGYVGENGLLSFGTSLPALFDSETRADFRDVVALTHADLRVIVYMRPWLAGLTLQGATTGSAGFSSEEGVDNKVYALATARGVRSFRAFETPEQQLGLLMGGPAPVNEVAAFDQTLKAILKSSGKRGGDINALFAAWARGDVAKLTAFGPENREMSPQAIRALLENRNRAWIPQIAAMLKQKHTYFVTVGAGHLVGKTGVPNLLRAAGYTVDGP